MDSPYADLDRPALSERRLAHDLATGPLWREVRVLTETGSTNAVVVDEARAGAPEGLVVVAERQSAGRGRLGREWVAPPRSALLFSVLLRPTVPPARWGLLPLLGGVALATAVSALTELDCRLKWPNDLMSHGSGRKLAGMLAEAVADAVVLGVGLNVTLRADELPDERAGSLLVEGALATDREPLLKETLRELARRYRAWQGDGGAPDALLREYRPRCETLGRRVRLELPGGDAVTGTAVDVDDDGRLVVREDTGAQRAWSAGDVVHLRPGE